MTRTVDIPHGKRYIIERCPYCGRRLAEWYEGEDHVTLLHGKAEIAYWLPVDIDQGGILPGEPIEGSSRCYRTICRIRRRLDRNHP